YAGVEHVNRDRYSRHALLFELLQQFLGPLVIRYYESSEFSLVLWIQLVESFPQTFCVLLRDCEENRLGWKSAGDVSLTILHELLDDRLIGADNYDFLLYVRSFGITVV